MISARFDETSNTLNIKTTKEPKQILEFYRKALAADFLTRRNGVKKARPNSTVFNLLIHDTLTEEEIELIFSKYELTIPAINFIKEHQNVSEEFINRLKNDSPLNKIYQTLDILFDQIEISTVDTQLVTDLKDQLSSLNICDRITVKEAIATKFVDELNKRVKNLEKE